MPPLRGSFFVNLLCESQVLVTAYHITTEKSARSIEESGRFLPSTQKFDWLGKGRYFFQEAPDFTFHWGVADRFAGGIERPVVFRAEILLDNFVDLLDYSWGQKLKQVYELLLQNPTAEFIEIRARQKQPFVGVDKRQAHWLDRFVIEQAIRIFEHDGGAVAGVRAAFYEGAWLYEGSHLVDRAHIQIAVRDDAVIRKFERRL